MNGLPKWAGPAALVMVIVVAHVTLLPGLASLDSFYHMGHAAQYRTDGLFDTAFPWGTTSIIGDLGADLWWGFHMVLVPFSVFAEPATAIRLAAVVLTGTLAAAVYFVLHRHRVSGAAWWTALFLVAVPNVLYRYVMVRPHVLSLALELLLLSLLVRGRWWHVLLTTTAIVWLHLGLFWMAPGIVAAYVLARWMARTHRDPEGVGAVKGIGAVAGGTVLGWILRPHPLASAELAWIQIVRLFQEKSAAQPLLFAGELDSLPLAELARTAWFFLILWLAAVATRTWWNKTTAAEHRTLVAAAALISGAFLILTVFSARRALVEFVAFGFLIVPLVWSFGVEAQTRRRLRVGAAILLALHLPWTAWRHSLNAEFVTFPPRPLAESAAWLEQHSDPGDIVFHGHWDNFAPLFAQNRVNRYLGGMDPIFQFAHDEGLYWEHFYLSGDLVVEYTCDAFPCYEGTATPTYEAIRDHFRARWVLVEPRRNPKLTAHLLQDPGFQVAFETPGEIILRVVDSSATPPGVPSLPRP